jgi:phosphoribosyl-ATP pyrophosphohydrolase/phosphoribosyl-AMP cyclohydrolase
LDKESAERLVQSMDFEKEHGLLPAVSQDQKNGDILMLAFMNREALTKTLTTGYAHYWSRSRKKLWEKGEESGHFQQVRAVYVDCDRDSLLLKVDQIGNCCHLGKPSCFDERVAGEPMDASSRVLDDVFRVVKDRIENPQPDSYVASLVAKGEDRVLRKIGEESTELMLAAKSEGPERVVSEAADLIFHTLVLLAMKGVELEYVYKELQSRRKPQGSKPQ